MDNTVFDTQFDRVFGGIDKGLIRVFTALHPYWLSSWVGGMTIMIHLSLDHYVLRRPGWVGRYQDVAISIYLNAATHDS
jgi:hypothetical protein